MARKSNQVTVSGDANWAKPFADYMATLSTGYKDKAIADRKLAAEEARQLLDDQWRKDQAAYTRERDKVADARYKDEQAKNALLLKKQEMLLNNQIDELDRAKKAREVSYEVSTLTPKFTLENHSPEVQARYMDVKNSILAEQDATISFLQGTGDINNALSIYENNLTKSKEEKASRNFKKQQRHLNLLGLKKELDALPDDISRQNRIQKMRDNLYTGRLNDLQNSIASGQAMTKKEQEDAILRSGLLDKYKGIVDKNVLTSNLPTTTNTRESLLASETARVKAANEAKLKEIDLIDQYYQRAIDSSGTAALRSYKGRSAADYNNMIKNTLGVDIGSWDNADRLAALEILQKEGISPAATSAALQYGISHDWFGIDQTFPSVGSKDFTKVLDFARNINNSVGQYGNNKVIVDKDRYQYIPANMRDLESLKADLVRIPKYDKRINVNPQYKVEPYTQEKAIQELDSLVGNTNNNDKELLNLLVPNDKKTINTEQGIGFQAIKNPEEAQRTLNKQRYLDSAEFQKQYNDNVTDSFKSDFETFSILDVNKDGTPRSWGDIVNEINDRLHTNKISIATLREAANDPKLQKELLKKANNILAYQNKAKIVNAKDANRFSNNYKKYIGEGLGNFISDTFGYDAKEVLKTPENPSKKRLEAYQNSVKALDDLSAKIDSFGDVEQGTEDVLSSKESYGASVIGGIANAARTAAIRYGLLKPAKKVATKAVKEVKDLLDDVTPAYRRKPGNKIDQVVSDIVNKTKSSEKVVKEAADKIKTLEERVKIAKEIVAKAKVKNNKVEVLRAEENLRNTEKILKEAIANKKLLNSTK